MTLTEKVEIERQAQSTATPITSDKLWSALIFAGMIAPLFPASAAPVGLHTIRQNSTAGTATLFSCEKLSLNAELINHIKRTYSITTQTQFTSFTDRFPFLLELLVDASDQLLRIFPNETIYRLEIEHDLEDENIEELVCLICTDLAPDEALKKLDAFDEAWFLDNLENTAGKLIFTLSFNDI